MRGPAADELAAIAAAYLLVTRREDARPRAEGSRWALAGRVRVQDAARARFVARATSRWNAAGRLDG